MEINNQHIRSAFIILMFLFNPLSLIVSMCVYPLCKNKYFYWALSVGFFCCVLYYQKDLLLPIKLNVLFIKSEFNDYFLFGKYYYLYSFGFVLGYIPLLALLIKFFFDKAGIELNKELFNTSRPLNFNILNPQDTQKGTKVNIGMSLISNKIHFIDRENLTDHSFYTGTTGSGKTNTVLNVVESLINNSKGLIYIDIKGSIKLRDSMKKYAIDNNKIFKCFSIIDQSAKYNPLSSGGQTEITEKVLGLRKWDNDYYRLQSYDFFQSLIKLLIFNSIEISVESISKYMETTELNKLSYDNTTSLNLNFKTNLINKSKLEHIKSSKTELSVLANSEVGGLMVVNPGDKFINIEQSIRNDEVLYFLLQPMKYHSYTELLTNLILKDIQSVLAKGLIQGFNENHIFIDEPFSVNVTESIKLFLSQARSTNTAIHLITQAPSDIDVDSAIKEVVINNVNHFYVHRLNNPKDVDLIADILGTKRTYEVTMQADRRSTGEARGSVKEVEEYKIHPNIIKNFPLGGGLIINQHTNKYDVVSFKKSAIES